MGLNFRINFSRRFDKFLFYFLHCQSKFFYCLRQQYKVFIFALAMQIFLIFCIGNANCFYFWHWKCKLGIILHVNFSHWFDEFFLFFVLAKQVFLMFASAMQIFYIFFIGNAKSFYFWHWECKLGINLCVNFSCWFDEFFVFCISNAKFIYFLHWQCKFFLFFALAMQILFIFGTVNANWE